MIGNQIFRGFSEIFWYKKMMDLHFLFHMLSFTEIAGIPITGLSTSFHDSRVWIFAKMMGMRSDERS